jgi:hypothetical protein
MKVAIEKRMKILKRALRYFVPIGIELQKDSIFLTGILIKLKGSFAEALQNQAKFIL